MSTAARLVPLWVRICTFVLAALNLAFGIAGYLSTTILFPMLDAASGHIDVAVLEHASREFSARNVAIGLGLLIVSRVGVPESMAIVLLIRAFVEAQTVVLMVVQSGVGPGLVVPLVFLAVEVVLVRTLFGVVQRRDAAAAPA
jgi:hypothetical protein